MALGDTCTDVPGSSVPCDCCFGLLPFVAASLEGDVKILELARELCWELVDLLDDRRLLFLPLLLLVLLLLEATDWL